MTRRAVRFPAATLAAIVLAVAITHAHAGPPYPIASDVTAGPYRVSIWADPDSTDDGSAAGRFWVTIHPVDARGSLPRETRVTLAASPSDRPGPVRTAQAEPAAQDPLTYFGAVVLDHEGPFAVRVAIAGPLGSAEVAATADATYDLRPAPWLIVLYVMPFLVAGFLWIRLLIKRRQLADRPSPLRRSTSLP